MTMENKDIVNGDSVNKIVAQTVAKYGMLEYVCYSANKRKKFIDKLQKIFYNVLIVYRFKTR